MIAVLAVFGGILFMAFVGQRNEAATRRQWQMLLDDTSSAYSEVEEHVLHERRMAEDSFRVAERAWALESLEESTRFLRIGASVVASCADTLPSLLRNLALLSRQASAIGPVEPLAIGAFRLRQLRTLAGIQAALHVLLTSSRERLTLRLRVLRYAVPAATRWLLRAVHQTIERPNDHEHWGRLADVRHDVGALTDESLKSLRVVLCSLAVMAHTAPAGR